MKVGSLFSGIGGLELGLERAGMEVVWQVEKDEFCRRVLAKHWPDVKRYEDVKDVGAHNLEPVDLIAGGFPCQPVSQAGKKLAQDDERWLWPEFARVIRELRPHYALVENVPGLLIRGFGDVLGDLAALGYDAEWGCVSAASVGAPHLRRRIFVIAYTTQSGRLREPVVYGSEGSLANTEGERQQRNGSSWQQEPDARQPEAQPQGRQSPVAHPHGTREQQPERLVTDERGRLGDGGEQVAYTQGVGCEGAGTTAEQVRTAPGCDGETSWRDWWSVEPDVGRVANGVPSRVDRLRALGNAVVPQVAEYVGHRLMNSLQSNG